MRKYFLLILAVAISAPVWAQQPAMQSASSTTSPGQLPADAATREQLLKLFDVLEVTQQMKNMMDAMGKAVQANLPAFDTLSAQQKADLDKVNQELYSKMMDSDMISTMLDQMIPVYQQHFTHADVDAIINFYSSAVGQKLLHEQPQMMQELMPRLMAKAQEKAETVLKEMDYNRRVQQIMDKGRAQTGTNPK